MIKDRTYEQLLMEREKTKDSIHITQIVLKLIPS